MNNNINKDLLTGVLEKCGFSEEMIKHLVDGEHISRYGLLDAICQAPLSLDEKIRLLSELEEEHVEDEEYITVIGQAITEAKEAIEACRLDGNNQVLYLFEEWYDTDSFVEKSYGDGLFRTEEEIKERIIQEYYSDDKVDSDMWFRAELWDLLDSKREQPRFDYYFLGDKICWFKKLYPYRQESGNIDYLPWEAGRTYGKGEIRKTRRFSPGGATDLNLSVPYKTGNIISIDCRPFGPPFHAMILDMGSQWDCCFPTIVFKVPYTNKWRLTSLKHKGLYHHAEINCYEPKLSPLFRIRKVNEEELTVDDLKLLYLSELIGGNVLRVDKVHDYWKSWDLDYAEFCELLDVLETYDYLNESDRDPWLE